MLLHQPLFVENQQDYYGFHRVSGGWVFRHWAPDARELMLVGEFNDWELGSHPMMSLGNGSWVLFLQGENALWEGCKVRLHVDDGALISELLVQTNVDTAGIYVNQ